MILYEIKSLTKLLMFGLSEARISLPTALPSPRHHLLCVYDFQFHYLSLTIVIEHVTVQPLRSEDEAEEDLTS